MKWLDPSAIPAWFDWLGILGFALTVGAFAIAAIELHQAKTSTETATRRLDEARVKLNNDQLSAILPQISTVIADLDFSIKANNGEVAHRSLLRYSYVANEAVALLKNLETDHTAVQDSLTQSASSALDVKAAIVSHANPDIARMAKAISKEIGHLSVQLAGITATSRYTLGSSNNV